MGAVEEHGRPKVDDRTDRGGHAARHRRDLLPRGDAEHPTVFATSVVDTAAARLIDVIRGRDTKILRDWLQERGEDWCARVKVVSIDPFEVYRAGLRPDLGHAVVVADPFHIVRLANRALDEVRRRDQHEPTGHRGRRGDPLYDIRKILLTGSERLNEKAWTKMEAALSALTRETRSSPPGSPRSTFARCTRCRTKRTPPGCSMP